MAYQDIRLQDTLGERRLNLALRKWQNSEWEWEKDWLVRSYDRRPGSNLQAKHIQVLRHHFGSGPHTPPNAMT